MDPQPLPARPSLQQYKKQAKDLLREFREAQARASADSATVQRVRTHHPRFANSRADVPVKSKFALADAQLVIAREHGFESWPKFAEEVAVREAAGFAASVSDPVADFIVVACVPRDGWHASGTLDRAEAILKAHPRVAKANIYTAAVLGDAAAVRHFLAADARNATSKGGPHDWDALTYLCFSNYLRLDPLRASGFVAAATALLDAGANPNTGWTEVTSEGHRHWEAAIYGAAGLAQNAPLTRLLLDRGADPNDDETAYHVAETHENTVMKILVESGKLNASGITTILLRKADWHDFEGFKWLLAHGADPNRSTRWGRTAFHHAVIRDNSIEILELLLNHGADPMLIAERPDPRPPVLGPPMSAVGIAVRRGRGDLLELLEKRGTPFELRGVERLIAACARNDAAAVRAIRGAEPALVRELLAEGGKLLAGFAGVGNTEGVRQLLDLGVDVNALFVEGDPYYDVTKGSTALHVAAWRGRPATVKLLLERGAAVSALDAKDRTPLMLAVKACVDSYWTHRRTPDSVKALLDAGATLDGLQLPSGYPEIDDLLQKFERTDRRSR
jgi:ankyrin repeat protein